MTLEGIAGYSQYQKCRTVLDFNEGRDDGMAVASAELWYMQICT